MGTSKRSKPTDRRRVTDGGASVVPISEKLGATLSLEESVSRLPQVSTARMRSLSKLGIQTIGDLVTHYPRRYMDLTRLAKCATASIGQTCTIYARVHDVKLKRPRYNLAIVEITIADETGSMIISVFHQPWLKDRLKADDMLMVAGKVEFNYGFMRMTNPFLEIVDEASTDIRRGRIIPVHPATAKLGAPQLRSIIETALSLTRGVYDPLPIYLRERHGLASRSNALAAIHFPASMDDLAEARRRLIYEELLLLQLHMMRLSQERASGLTPTTHITDGPHVEALERALPYRLTDEQIRAREEIFEQMSLPKVANHMLLGDVGTGKTVVAAFAIAASVDSGGQSLLMAPTEVLAAQHESSLGALFDNAGITHALLTGSTPAGDRKRILEGFASGQIDVLIGTHALIEPDVIPKNLTLAVIDEQQRFGVEQREALIAKDGSADALFLTATPIPRTLALTLFGNLTLSYIHTRPHRQAHRETKVLREQSKGHAYDAAIAAIARGEQVYVVCPLIGVSAEERDAASGQASDRSEKSEKDEVYHPKVAIEDDSWEVGNVTAAKTEARFLQDKVFVDSKVGLLHGEMRSEEKSDIMQRFSDGEIDVLVATTVIEVGVDVPNATVMIVQDADRFGLSQLHQLRGRVGRGDKDAEVFYISASNKEEAIKRLGALEASDDGFEIAKYDLQLRREGDILGNRQSGASALKLVNVIRDSEIIEQAHADAMEILEADPDLGAPENLALARQIKITYKS